MRPLILAVALVNLLAPAVARADGGMLDSSFGSGGVVNTTMGQYAARGLAGGIQPDGRIVVAADSAVGRLLPNGAADPSFGGSGFVPNKFPGSTASWDIVMPAGIGVQADGSVIVGGRREGYPPYGPAAERFLPDGTPDPTFGDHGLAHVTPPDDVVMTGMAVQPDGRILLVGRVYVDDAWHIILVRFLADGRPDPAFGKSGVVLEDLGRGAEGAAVAVDATGRVLVGGVLYPRYTFFVARFGSDGTLDRPFGSNGFTETVVPSTTTMSADALLAEPDGDIVSGAYLEGEPNVFYTVLARYTPDGAPDPSFGSGGVVADPNGSGAYGVAVDSQGRYLTAMRFQIVRYLHDGTRDVSFGDGGAGATPPGLETADAMDVFIQPNDKPVAAGWSSCCGQMQTVLARWDASDPPPQPDPPAPPETPAPALVAADSSPPPGDASTGAAQPAPVSTAGPQPSRLEVRAAHRIAKRAAARRGLSVRIRTARSLKATVRIKARGKAAKLLRTEVAGGAWKQVNVPVPRSVLARRGTTALTVTVSAPDTTPVTIRLSLV